eukprot:m.180568 g.180568  ORF g.180568 m.180568 type:complete len:835 (+) comp32026_c0_seq2:65-2569(+)
MAMQVWQLIFGLVIASKRESIERPFVRGTTVGVDTIPNLQWPKPHPSDWIDVTKGCGSGAPAKGDGKTDATAAIQACFDVISNHRSQHSGNSTVFIPSGTYLITKPLILTTILGGMVVGEGELTQLVWGGATGGKMLVSDGCSRSRFVGLVFDGQNQAAVGFEHDAHSPGLFETRIRHQNNKFVNFQIAGIRIGYNRTGGKKETSEVLYENNVFANNGHSKSCLTGNESFGCGGVVILNFNDYDNAFTGCHFQNNSYGIFSLKMANMYVRDSRFEQSSMADIVLAPSAGNSVRRCVSVGSNAFVTAPHHAFANPVSIQDCRIDSWTGSAAIDFNFRGPLTLFDNQFTNAPNGSTPVNATPWMTGNVSTNTLIMFTGNQVDGKPASALELLPFTKQPNVIAIDLPTSPTTVSAPPTPNPKPSSITPTTRFLKSWWPIPTAFIDASDQPQGCGVKGVLANECVQATIAAAAAKGNGAAAYFPPGFYSVNESIVVPGGKNFTVLGGGFNTIFGWSGTNNATPAVMHVQGGGGGLRLEQFVVESGSKEQVNNTRILHDGAAKFGADDVGQAKRQTTYDGIYTSGPNGENMWSSPGMVVDGLRASDVVHFVHVDGNVAIKNSAAGIVLIGFMIQGNLNISGKVQPDLAQQYPAIGVTTLVGLLDHDLDVSDDQSIIISDFYSEQMHSAHIELSGGASGSKPGRVTIAAVKTQGYTSNCMSINNYQGDVFLSASFFFGGPTPAITQKGSAQVSITLLGNAFMADNTTSALTWDLASGGKGKNSAVGNLLADYGTAIEPIMNNKVYTDILWSGTNATIAVAFDDLRRLGLLDLAINYPELV